MASYTKRDGQIPSRFVCIYILFSSSYRTSKKNILLLHQSLGSYSDNGHFWLDSIRTQEAKVIIPAYSESGKCYNKQSLYLVYQHNNIFHILAKKQHRNKIYNLIDSQLFVFHLVSFLALGRIQSVSQSSFPTINLSSEENRSMAHPWIVAAKREKDGLWSLSYIFIETCILHKSSCFYKTIGIWKGKYAYLNIVYFDLAYIS